MEIIIVLMMAMTLMMVVVLMMMRITIVMIHKTITTGTKKLNQHCNSIQMLQKLNLKQFVPSQLAIPFFF